MKQIFLRLGILFLGIVLGAGGVEWGRPVWQYFQPPQVTLVNLTGEAISNVEVSLGQVRCMIPEMKDKAVHTISMKGRFSETSTRITWTDASGPHTAMADDYMENNGMSQTMVVLTADKKAQALMKVQ